MRTTLLLLCLLLGSLTARAADAPDRASVEFFEKKIRPVLVEHCYKCHSVDAQKNKKLRGGLYLDTKEGWMTGGDSGPAIVPGNAAKSLLVQTLRYTGDVKMPPKQKLPANVVADFETWINKGAVDPRSGTKVTKIQGLSIEEGRKFWSYTPVKKPTVPVLADAVNVRNEIDAFIQTVLREKGLKSASEADRAALIRRLSYDLIGLPPSPEEVDAFVADKRVDAYERLVDRLLASPHFGERWGRHWLDVARYAESITLRGTIFKEAWRYRDLVIERLNTDYPFNRFIREQIAGDLLPAVNLERKRQQLTATTFLALGNNNLEEQDKKQLVMDVVDEQLDTIGRAFLAQTLGCARCHDHKFDPVPTKDYYALAGILRNTKTLSHANVSKWLEVPLPGDPAVDKAAKEHEIAVANLQERIQALKTKLGKVVKVGKPGKPTVRKIVDLPGIVVDDSKARKVGEWTKSVYSGTYVGEGYIHDGATGKGNKTLTFQPEIPKTGKYEVRLAYCEGTNRADKVPVTIFSADGEKTIFVNQKQRPPIEGLFISLGEYKFEQSGQGFVIISNEDTKGHVIADAVLFIPADKRDTPAKDVPKVAKTPQKSSAKDNAELRKLEKELKALTANSPRRELVMSVMEEKTIEDARVHIRGTVHNLGEKAPRGFLQAATWQKMPTMPADQSGRVQLADWLAGDENPLTARVFVNRTWHWLIGQGIVRTTDNFGTTGEKPSHPELLDYLASRFVEQGWSVKSLVRQIVLSHTYRQSSRCDGDTRSRDPENILLSHANRRRLDAESIRDTILTVSGQLENDQGGPTFPSNLNADYGFKHKDTRRSIYSPVFRNALPELFEVFDFADPSVSTGRRNVSTVAPQALFLMNHPFVLEQSRQAAKRALQQEQTDEVRLDRAYRLALGRTPTPAERRLALAFLTKANQPEDGWTQMFQILFSTIDFRYVD